MNLNKNLDEFIIDANILKSEKFQIEPKYRNQNSRLIKDTNMTIQHDQLVISIQIMSIGGVYVYISDQTQLKKFFFEVKGSQLCQNGCQIFQIQNALILLLIFQDGQVIMRDLKEGNQEIVNISENFLIVSKCNFVKNDEINFLVMVDVNKIILIKYDKKQQLKLQNYQISSWCEYLSEKYIFDYLIEIIQGTHIGIMKDQVVIIQLVDANIYFSKAKLKMTQEQKKIYDVEFFPYSPYKSHKKALFASIAIKTYTSVDIYELRLFTNIKESLQLKEVQNFCFKSFQLELKNSFRLEGTIQYTREQIFMNNQFLFLTQNSTIKYVDLYGNGQFNQILSLDTNKYLISIVENDVPVVIYDQYTSLLCQSPHSLQQEYCTFKQQALYFNQKIKDKFQQTNDMSMIIQNLNFDFDHYDLEDYFLLLHIIFRQPLIIYDKIGHYDQPELIQLLSDIFEEIQDDFIYVKSVFKRFDKQLLQDKLHDILDQIKIFIKSQDKYQIQLKESFPIKNEKILRLILATSSHLLQDLHNYYFYCIMGLYLLTSDNEEQLENIKQYESSYFLLLSSVKLILSKQIKNYLLAKQLPEISQETETFNQVEIMSGVSSILRYIFDVYEISKFLAYSAEFNQNTYKILKIYPINKELLLEYQILNLIKKYKKGSGLNQELLILLSRYEAFYGVDEIKLIIRLIMKKFFNQNVINYILMRHSDDEDLFLKLIDYTDKFDFADSLGLVTNKIKAEQFNYLIPIFYDQRTLKLLSNTKINNSLLTYIHKQIISSLNEYNLNNQQQINYSSNLIQQQASLLSIQGLKKQAMKLIILYYDLLELQDKNINIINWQRELLMDILTIFQGMSHQNRYFLVFKDLTNINIFKTRKEFTGNLNILKNIIPYGTQLQNIWDQINAETNQLELQTNCLIIKRQDKNNLTYDEYYELDFLNKLPDNFRFIQPDTKKLDFIKASYYQQQLLYNISQAPKEDHKKYNEIISIQDSNQLLKQTVQSNQRNKIIDKVEKVNNFYKVYNQQEILNIVELLCIQQYLMLNGYEYTQETKTMASYLLDIIDIKQDIKQDESQDDIIIASVYFIDLIKYFDSDTIQVRINKILDICMKHNIIRQLLDRVLNQKPSKFIVKSIIKYLSQNSQNNLIIEYFSNSFTDWAVQELTYIENDFMAEMLALKLLSQLCKARIKREKIFCLEPDTVEALLGIQFSSDKYYEVIKTLIKLASEKQNFCQKLKVLQENGITYKQYKTIKLNKQMSNQNEIITPIKDQLTRLNTMLNILKKNNVGDPKKQLQKKVEKSISDKCLISRVISCQNSTKLKDQQRSNQVISQIYELLQQKIKLDNKNIQPQESELSLFKNAIRGSDRKSIFTNNQQISDFSSDTQSQSFSMFNSTRREILMIDQVDELKVTHDRDDRQEKIERQSKNDQDQQINKIQIQQERLDDLANRETEYPILIKNQPIKQKDQFQSSRSTINQSLIQTSDHSQRESNISVQQNGLNQINKFLFKNYPRQQQE